MNFVIAQMNEDGKPGAFYQSNTPNTLELSEDLQQALVFTSKPSARSAQAAYQREFPDKEIAVVEVTVQVKLA
jgi:hypothetical protein